MIKLLEMLFVGCVLATFLCMFIAASTINFDFFLVTIGFGAVSYVLFLCVEYFGYDNNLFPSCKPRKRRRDR